MTSPTAIASQVEALVREARREGAEIAWDLALEDAFDLDLLDLLDAARLRARNPFRRAIPDRVNGTSLGPISDAQ